MSESTTASAPNPPGAADATQGGCSATYVPKEQLDYCARSLKGTRDALESADVRIAELEAENKRLLGSVEILQEALKNQRREKLHVSIGPHVARRLP